jgi:hypothetical protein
MLWSTLKSAVNGLLGSKARRLPAAPTRHYYITNPYHAVSIVAPAGACEAARQVKGQRFLAKDAPPLPLRGCQLGAGTCHCGYKHHDDRRVKARRKTDRRVDSLSSRPSWAGQERRQSGGRRSTD